MALLSDKAQKIEFKKIASADPESYYPTNALKKNGFQRYQCEKCGRFFWSSIESNVCGEPGCNKGFQVVKNNPSKNSLSFIRRLRDSTARTVLPYFLNIFFNITSGIF